MNAPETLSRWTRPGSSRVPFWAYTDAQLYQRELRQDLLRRALVLRRAGGRDPEHRRLQAQPDRRAAGDHGARPRRAEGPRHRPRHPRRREPLRPPRRALLPAAARQRAQLRLPVPPVDLQAQWRPGGPAVQGRREGGDCVNGGMPADFDLKDHGLTQAARRGAARPGVRHLQRQRRAAGGLPRARASCPGWTASSRAGTLTPAGLQPPAHSGQLEADDGEHQGPVPPGPAAHLVRHLRPVARRPEEPHGDGRRTAATR